MSAEEVPQPAPNQKQDLIQRFRQAYKGALEDAKTNATMTRTEGWQSLYQQHRQADKDTRRSIAKRMHEKATMLEDFGLDEEDEKTIKDAVKESAALRAGNAAFESQVIERMCAPVKACQRICDEYRHAASRAEHDSPMYNVGLEQLMVMEIQKQPRPDFNAETGEIRIIEPNT